MIHLCRHTANASPLHLYSFLASLCLPSIARIRGQGQAEQGYVSLKTGSGDKLKPAEGCDLIPV